MEGSSRLRRFTGAPPDRRLIESDRNLLFVGRARPAVSAGLPADPFPDGGKPRGRSHPTIQNKVRPACGAISALASWEAGKSRSFLAQSRRVAGVWNRIEKLSVSAPQREKNLYFPDRRIGKTRSYSRAEPQGCRGMEQDRKTQRLCASAGEKSLFS